MSGDLRRRLATTTFARAGAWRISFMAVLCSAITLGARTWPPTDDARYFVTMLGSDTLSIERYTRTSAGIEGEAVFRNPRTSVVRFSARFGRPDTITYFELATRLAGASPDSAPQFQRITTVTGDSAENDVRQKGVKSSAISAKFSLRRGAVPFLSVSVAFLDEMVRQMQKAGVDSFATESFGAGGNPPNFPCSVVRRGKDSVLIDLSGLRVGGRLDANGRLVVVDNRATTVKTVSRQVPPFDVAALTRQWLAREQSGAVAGTVSPRDTARLQLGAAQILIDYGRPSRRGRQIFGALVPFDSVWRSGANAATQLVTTADLRIGGATVPAGTYSLWSIPTPTGATLIINRQHGQWGTQYDSTQDLVRVPMAVRELAAPVEQLTATLRPTSEGALLLFAWESRELAVPVQLGR